MLFQCISMSLRILSLGSSNSRASHSSSASQDVPLEKQEGLEYLSALATKASTSFSLQIMVPVFMTPHLAAKVLGTNLSVLCDTIASHACWQIDWEGSMALYRRWQKLSVSEGPLELRPLIVVKEGEDGSNPQIVFRMMAERICLKMKKQGYTSMDAIGECAHSDSSTQNSHFT